MKTRAVVGLVAGVVVLGAVGFGVTGVAYLPVSIALGPCLMDWTSPSSYKSRASPLGSTTFSIGSTGTGRVCYGRPSARGRTVFGGIVAYDQPWRTGANEPTRIYSNTDFIMADIPVPAGRYALYTVPGPEEWEIRLSRSILHWGNDLSASVQAREIGRATLPIDSTDTYVETFTVRPEEGDDGEIMLVLEWESTKVQIPIRQARDLP
ncbi:MAG: DUF2911 domain-containing protein [Gemmatimonadales bacterium]|nr:DUF2911 domain-containing protein [Gemmatimonadales bacterium]